jgi:hypothetical protein
MIYSSKQFRFACSRALLVDRLPGAFASWVALLLAFSGFGVASLRAQLVVYTADFEAVGGYSLASLHGQNSWTVVQGAASVTNTGFFSGSQSVLLAANTPPTIISQTFSQFTGQSILFVDFYSRPTANADVTLATLFDAESSRVGFAKVGSSGEVYAYNGNGVGGGSWVGSGYTVPVDAAGQAQNWVRFTFRQDYTAKKWSLFVNGALAAYDLGFRDNTKTLFSLFTLQASASASTAFDYFYVSPVNPLFTDDDNDGLPDAWELKHLGKLTYGPTDDPGNVGRTLLQSYAQGLSPWPAATVATGLRAWYRADLGVTKDASNKVSLWVDLSGQGSHVGQTARTDWQPTYVASAMNSKPAVQFGGALATSGSVDVLGGSNDLTIIAVVEPGTQPVTGGPTIVYLGDDGNLASGLTSGWASNNQYYLHYRDTANAEFRTPTINANAGQIQVLAVVKSGTTGTSYLDGVSQGTTAATTTLKQTPSPLAIGNWPSGYFDFTGKIAEVLVYNRALAPAERQSIEAALAARYVHPDADGDGLPDTWERKNLGHTGYVATDDPGNVGRTLLQSYQQGLSPWPAPTVANGLRAWYRAELGVTKDANNKVSRWVDLSGQGSHVTQTTRTDWQPSYVATAMNGKPAVQFGGALATPTAVDVLGGSDNLTIIAVVEPGTQPVTGGPTILYLGDDGNVGYGLTSSWASNNQYYLHFRDPANVEFYTPTMNPAPSQVHVLSVVKDGITGASFVDGISQGVRAATATLKQPSSPLAIGNWPNGYFDFTGKIAEILVYNRALTPAERQSIETALAARYVAADSDADGLPDAWEFAQLGTLAYGATDDPGSVGRTLFQSNQQSLSPWPAPVVANGLRAWYRADRGVVKDGNNKVSRWADLSGRGSHLVQFIRDDWRPLWVSSALNGNPAVQFGGSLAANNPVDTLGGSNDLTIIAVVAPQAQTNVDGAALVDLGVGDAGEPNGLVAGFNGGNQYRLHYSNTDGSITFRAPPMNTTVGQPALLTVVKGGLNVQSYRDGIWQTTSAGIASLTQAPAYVAVGSRGYQGQIAEVLVYNRALTDTERQSIEAALTAKYFAADSDGDGLPDAWEQKYFGSLVYGAADDPGSVGRTLLQSYQLSLSPWPVSTVATGLRAWYRADLGVKKDASNRVSQWTDLSGRGSHLVQFIRDDWRPLWVSSALNGNPAVQFGGSLTSNNPVDILGGSNDLTIIAVVAPQAQTNVDGAALVDLGVGDAGEPNGLVAGFNGGNQYRLHYSNTDGSITFRAPPMNTTVGQPALLTVVKGGLNVQSYRNGIWQTASPGIASLTQTPAYVAVGSRGYQGQIAEVFVYNRALTDTERQSIESALTAKYFAADADGDGLPDAWEQKYFGGLGYGSSDDPGAVGRTLLQNYQQGLSPWPTAAVTSGLRAWYRADAGVVKDASNLVSQWTDVSGRGSHVIQVVRPDLRPTLIASAVNGKPALKFENYGYLASSDPADTLGGSNDLTIIAVVVPEAPTAADEYAIINLGQGNGQVNGLSTDWNQAGRYRLHFTDPGSAELKTTPVTTTTGRRQMLSVVKSGISAATYLNRALQNNSTTPAALVQTPAFVGVGTHGYTGKIAEVLVYNRALTTTERESVEAALSAKYQLDDVDDDGLSDAWELKYFGTMGYSAIDDPGVVGRTLLQSYQQGVSPWSAPAVSAGLRAWYRSDQGVIKDASNYVTLWADLSGHGFNLRNPTTAGPIYVTNGVGGQPGLEFASLRNVESDSIDLQAGGADITVIAVVQPEAVQPAGGELFAYSSEALRVYTPNGTPNVFPFYSNISTGGAAAAALTESVPQVIAYVREGTSFKSYRNGSVQANDTVAATALVASPGPLRVGYSFRGRIAEILFYNRALTSTERGQIETNLVGRYVNTSPSLPAVALTAPADGSVFAYEDTIVLSATASASSGISKVEFYTDEITKLGEGIPVAGQLGSYRLAFASGALPATTYEITAKATDSNGASATSPSRTFTVNDPMPVSTIPSGLRAWYRANQGVTTNADDVVLKWWDLSGNGFHLTSTAQGAATSGAFTLAGRQPTVQFGGTGAVLSSGAIDLMAGVGNLSVVVVLSPDVAQASDAKVLNFGNSTYVVGTSPSGSGQLFFTGPWHSSALVPASVSPDIFQVVSFVRNGTSVASYLNGSAQGTASVSSDALPATSGVLQLGDKLKGKIVEILIYNRALNASERQQLETSLIGQYVNQAPTVVMTSPLSATRYEAQANVLLAATATDSDGSVSKVEFYDDQTKLGEVSSAPYQLNVSTLGGGLHYLSAVATDNYGATRRSPEVVIDIGANFLPRVTLTAPMGGATFTAPASLTLVALASDEDGTINRVEYYRNNVKIGESTTEPYSFAVSGLAGGSHAFTARAYDNAGAYSESDSVAIVVVDAPAPPVVTLTGPANNSTMTLPGTLALSATASSPAAGGSITKVEFRANGAVLARRTSAPYAYTWTLVPPGTYTLVAVAYDNKGLSTSSNAISVQVVAPHAAPAVRLIDPVAGSRFSSTETIALVADANAGSSTVTKVEFYAGVTKLGEVTSYPYEFAWSGAAAGTYSLTAKAYDDGGGVSTSAPAQIVVAVAPTVALAAPIADASYAFPASITLAATASVSAGTVAKVEFYQGSVLLGVAMTSPYEFVCEGLTPGSYALKARAYGDSGVTADSAPVAIQITGTAVPQVMLVTPEAGLTFNVNTSISLQATSKTPGGTVTKVEFYRDTTLVGMKNYFSWEDPMVPSGIDLYLSEAGVFSLTARAFDSSGNYGDSTPVTLTVSANPPPLVALEKTGVTSNSVSLSATATTTASTITKVEFYVDGTLASTATASPYTYTAANLGMGSHVFKARAYDATNAVSVSLPVTQLLVATLPFSTGFEASEGYALGTLPGQLGWSTDYGSALVTNADAKAGSRSVVLRPSYAQGLITLPVSSNPAQRIVFVDFFAKPAGGPWADAGSVFASDDSRVAVEIEGNHGRIWVWAAIFSGESYGMWLDTKQTIPLDQDKLAVDWIRFTQRFDYVTHNWDLYLNGRMVLADIPFDSYFTQLSTFSMRVHQTAIARLDNLSIGYTNPLFTDTAGDGIDDTWKIAHGIPAGTYARALDPAASGLSVIQKYVLGLDPQKKSTLDDGISDGWKIENGLSPLTVGLANLDPYGDGLTYLQKYILAQLGTGAGGGLQDTDGDGIPDLLEFANGTDPSDYYNGLLPQIASTTSGTGFFGPGGLISVRVTNAAGEPLVNAPITLTIPSDLGTLATDPAEPGYSPVVFVRTDASGIARAYAKPLQQ